MLVCVCPPCRKHENRESSDNMATRRKRLEGKRVLLFIDFQFEDLELLYPKMRLEEEGAKVRLCPAGINYSARQA